MARAPNRLVQHSRLKALKDCENYTEKHTQHLEIFWHLLSIRSLRLQTVGRHNKKSLRSCKMKRRLDGVIFLNYCPNSIDQRGRYRQQRICQMRISYAPGVFLDGTTGKNTSRSTIIINVPKWMKMVAAH